MRNKAIFQANTPQAKQTSDQKAENTPKDRPKPCIFAPSGHDHRPKERATPEALQHSKLKYILNFALFGLPNSRENTKHPPKFIYFCPVLPCF